MPFARLLFGASVVLLGGLLAYAASLLTAACVALLSRRRGAPPSPPPREGSVTVLVPSHNEGAGLVDAVRTLISQDHPGPIEVRVLFETAEDTSMAPLGEAFALERIDADTFRAEIAPARSLRVVKTGVRHKSARLNHALEDIQSDFVAMLDADHRADPHWISSALDVLEREGAAAVQGVRRPLGAGRVPQLWDSAENHVGNEGLNIAAHRLGQPVFFTGTTAVFRSSALVDRRFGSCITEDTELSLDMLLSGERIAYDPRAGSYEEVAPTLRSFVARRRRWAAGHTQTFARHLGAIARSRLPTGVKLRLVAIGVFYLVPLAVLALLWCHAAYALVQFPQHMLWASLVLTAIGVTLALVPLGPLRRLPLTEILVAAVWILPQSVEAILLVSRFRAWEEFHYILEFPLSKPMLPLYLTALLVPLGILLVSALAVRVLSWKHVSVLTLTYPFMLFFDLYGALLGLADLARGSASWAAIERANQYEAGRLPGALAAQLTTGRAHAPRWRRWLWVPAVALGILVSNDLLSPNECGEVRPFLWKPLLFRWPVAVRLTTEITKTLENVDEILVTVTSRVTGQGATQTALMTMVDGQPGHKRPVVSDNTPVVETYRFPVGWERHTIDQLLTGPGLVCSRQRAAASSLVELRDRRLLVNGEEMVLKGVVPSFSAAGLHLDLDVGLRQIKEAGANAVRIYHEPSPEFLAAAERAQLVVLAQPHHSTWNNLDVMDAAHRRHLLGRYEDLLLATDGQPFSLFNVLGNELEIGHGFDDSSGPIRELLESLRTRDFGGRRFYRSYSTYLTFANYPVDIIGINMLDTGDIYWRQAMSLLQSFGTPFFASEFGGFVAFTESPPVELRMARMGRHWRTLLQSSGVGGFFYESHDNWAQALPPGAYNDPLSAEQPDDTRGLWDHDNKPKAELAALMRLYADVEVRPVPELVEEDATELQIEVHNLRPYALSQVRLHDLRDFQLDVGDLPPGAARTITVAAAPEARELRFRYRSHHGLVGTCRVPLRVPRAGERPFVLNPDFVTEPSPAGGVAGHLVEGDVLDVVVPPNWSGVRVNGQLVPGKGRFQISHAGSLHDVRDLMASWNGGPWQAFEQRASRGGPVALHMLLPNLPRPRLLVAGVGAGKLEISAGGLRATVKTHSYRENVIDLTEVLGADPAGRELELTINREHVVYVPGRLLPSGQDLVIELERPRVFAPTSIVLSRP